MVINTNHDINAKTNSQTSQKVKTDVSASPAVRQEQAAQDSKDQVQLSPQAQSIKSVEASIQASEGVDNAKVADIKARIESGEYTINSDSIASKMLQYDIK